MEDQASHYRRFLYLILVTLLITSCRQTTVKTEAAPASPCPPEKTAELQSEVSSLKQALTTSERKVQQLEQELTAIKMQAIEQDAVVNELRRRSENQQKSLDAAIVDVVRSKAKLRSLESKAEAASTLAEAEIALKALQSKVASSDWVALDEIAIAEHLLGMSAQEFNAQNYGGALYLANQTKGRVRVAQDRLSSITNISPSSGEASFAQPLPLKVMKNSNLRSGPGLDHKIIVELEKGTLIVGISHQGQWIHVQTPDGMTGWIYQPLIEAR